MPAYVFKQDEQMEGIGRGWEEIELLVVAACRVVLGMDSERSDTGQIRGLKRAQDGILEQRTTNPSFLPLDVDR